MSQFGEGGSPREQMGMKAEKPELNKDYYEKSSPGGTDFSVSWDDGYDDYTIYFPEIKIGDEARDRGVDDQVIRISQIPEVAKKVFDFATKISAQEEDVYEVYKQVEEYARTLPYDYEEMNKGR